VARTKIPPGALIVQLQRALNYVQAEVGMGEDGTPCDVEDLGGADALTLIDSVQPEVCEKRRKQLWDAKRGGDENADEQPRFVDTEISPAQVRVLSGHEGEVYACAWHPATDTLASGSGDSTARIWSLEAGNDSAPVVLRHIADGADASPEVCALDWNTDGTLLATGSYDAIGRIWTKGGELQNYLRGHEGAIFSLRWNERGDYVVTASFDMSTIVWDVSRGTKLQQFKFHRDACLDVHWRTNETFASCSRDRDIYVCEVGVKTPLRVYKGDPSGTCRVAAVAGGSGESEGVRAASGCCCGLWCGCVSSCWASVESCGGLVALVALPSRTLHLTPPPSLSLSLSLSLIHSCRCNWTPR
jgi:transducin (beta)-like 1